MNITGAAKSVFGNSTAAIVFAQLAYWQQRAYIEKEGHVWVAKTYEDMAKETGVSLRSCKRAVASMQKRGFIETKTFSIRRGKLRVPKVLHLRLTGASSEILAAAKWKPVATITNNPIVQSLHHSKGQNDTILYIVRENIEVKLDASALESDKESKKENKEESKEESKTEQPKALSKREMILQAKKVAKCEDVATQKQKKVAYVDSVDSLCMLYKTEYANVYENETINIFPVDRGYAKAILGRFAKVTDATEVLRKAVSQWADFGLFVEKRAGLYKVPQRPNLGFMAKYTDYMLDFYKVQSAKPAPEVKSANILAAEAMMAKLDLTKYGKPADYVVKPKEDLISYEEMEKLLTGKSDE